MKLNFNPSEYGKDTRGQGEYDSSTASFSPIPEGFYPAVIDDASVKTWEDGGISVQLRWSVKKNPYNNRKVWMTLNLKHKVPTKEIKSRYMLADICAAIGHEGDLAIGADSPPNELVGKTCEIELIVLSAQLPKYPNPKNYIKSVRAPRDEVQVTSEPSPSVYDDDDIPF